MHLPLRHDLYCTIVGGYAIWGLAAAAVHLHRMLKCSAPGTTIVAEVQGWLVTLVRLTVLSFLGLIIVPFIAGLYLDLVMMPLRSV